MAGDVLLRHGDFQLQEEPAVLRHGDVTHRGHAVHQHQPLSALRLLRHGCQAAGARDVSADAEPRSEGAPESGEGAEHGGDRGGRRHVRGRPSAGPAGGRRPVDGLAVQRHPGAEERGHQAGPVRQQRDDLQVRLPDRLLLRGHLPGGLGRSPDGSHLQADTRRRHLLPAPLSGFQRVPRDVLVRVHQRHPSLHVGGEPRCGQHLQAGLGGAAAAPQRLAPGDAVELGGARHLHVRPVPL